MWAVTASVTRVTSDGFAGAQGLPMFFLDPRVQGALTPEAAEKIARDILAPFHRPEETVTIYVHEVIHENARS